MPTEMIISATDAEWGDYIRNRCRMGLIYPQQMPNGMIIFATDAEWGDYIRSRCRMGLLYLQQMPVH